MKLSINEFTILSPQDNKSYSQKFSESINLIVGVKDSGKSTIARSMLYTLGCDVKNLDMTSKMPSNIYILDFNIGNTNFILIRKKLKDGKGKNFFKVIKNNEEVKTFYSTKDFSEYLNEIMGIKVITRDKDKNETKFYPNHIFLPFYIDQDFSWQSYLYSTFNGINFINNYKKIVLEYFTGARPNEYYDLQLRKTELKYEIEELGALIKSKQLIIDENINNIHIIEDVDIESFKDQYQFFINTYQNILDTEHELKKTVNDSIYKKNSYEEINNKIDSSIESFIETELIGKCPNCNQIVHKTMEDNYRLYSLQENLINERDKVNMYLQDIDEEFSESMTKLQMLDTENTDIKTKLDATPEFVDLNERADSYALKRVNSKLLIEIDNLRVGKDEKTDDLEKVNINLNKLNNTDVATPYKELMIKSFKDLAIDFSYNNYYTSNLESVKISLSGATKVQAYIAQYLSIYELACENKNTITIPMFVDTFLKDDFNGPELEKTAKYVFERLENKHQSFIFISDNDQTLNSIKDFKYDRTDFGDRFSVLNQDYQINYEKYSEYISAR